MLTDSFNRTHNYLRISLTDKCNLRCTYCNPVNFPKGYFSGHKQMTAEEIEKIASVFVAQGINKIRITGGEPLVRKDAKDIIKRLSKFPVDLAITTNGVFVHEFIDTFKSVGLKSINISLDSLKSKNFFKITGRDEFKRVKQNIDLLLANDFHVKINMVAIKGENENEIPNFVAWTKEKPVHVRFIEFMPFAGNAWSRDKIFSYQEIIELIASNFSLEKLHDDKHDTAKKYTVKGYQGTFAIISSITLPFCNGCNRLRLTTDGKMKNCLFSKQELDILGNLRSGKDILPLIKQCVWQKEKMLGGQFKPSLQKINVAAIQNRSMIGIGG